LRIKIGTRVFWLISVITQRSKRVETACGKYSGFKKV